MFKRILVLGLVLLFGQSLIGAGYLLTYKDDAVFDGWKNTKYNGWLFGDTTEHGTANVPIIGTVVVKVNKPRYGAYKITATVVKNGLNKKITFSGTGMMGSSADWVNPIPVVADLLSKSNYALKMQVRVCQQNVWGTLIDGDKSYFFDCGRDFGADKNSANAVKLMSYEGQWSFATYVRADTGEFNGFAGFTMKVDKKGKAKITGVLPDATKLSFTSQIVLDDNGAHLPFYAQAYKKFGGFGGQLFNMDNGFAEESNSDLSVNLTTKVHSSRCLWTAPGTIPLREGQVFSANSLLLLYNVFKWWTGNVPNTGGKINFNPSGNYEMFPFLDTNSGVSGMHLIYDSFNGVDLSESEFPVKPYSLGLSIIQKKVNVETTTEAMRSKIRMSYNQKTGAITGGFTMYSAAGVKFNMKINGAMVDNIGYLNASCKNKGGIGFMILPK